MSIRAFASFPRAAAAALAALVLSVGAPGAARAAADCACRDLDHSGTCDAGEPLIAQSEWIGPGAPPLLDVRPASFTLPEGCEVITEAGTNPVRVEAANIFAFDDIRITSSSAKGLLFIADGDVVVRGIRKRLTWRGAGQNTLLPKIEPNTAIARATVAFKAGGTCHLANTFIEAGPIGGNQVIGMQCRGDITLRGVEFFTSGFDVQSLEGSIDAANVAGAGGTTDIRWCFPDPSGAIVFPCTISTEEQRASVCDGSLISVPSPAGGGGPNKLRALAYGGTLIARGDVKLQSDSADPTSRNAVEGRYGVTIISELGNVDLTNARVDHTTAPLGGADIYLAAGPATVDRYRKDIMKETFSGGCSGGFQVIYNAGTCFQSMNPIKYCGSIAGNTGPSSTPPCKTNLVPATTGGGF